MRWYEANSEQLNVIDAALVARVKRLTESVDSARKAGLIRQYEMERVRLLDAQRALDTLADIRRNESY